MDCAAEKIRDKHGVRNVPRGLLGLGAAAILFIAFRGLSQAAPENSPQEATLPPPCDAWHRASGEGQAIDLEQTRRGYARLRERLSGSLLRGIETETGRIERQGYDLGLRACTGSDKRRSRPGREVPAELRGKTLWFFRLDGEKLPPLPGNRGADASVMLLAVRTDGLGALERAAKSWGRPVNLAPRGLAESLGVHCAPALVSVSSEGEVKIHENP